MQLILDAGVTTLETAPRVVVDLVRGMLEVA